MGEQTVVGVVGVGLLGSAVSGVLLEAGYPIVGHDVVAERVQALVARGGRGARSAAEVARSARVVFTILPTLESVEQAIAGAEGVPRRRVRDGLVREARHESRHGAERRRARRGAHAGAAGGRRPVADAGGPPARGGGVEDPRGQGPAHGRRPLRRDDEGRPVPQGHPADAGGRASPPRPASAHGRDAAALHRRVRRRAGQGRSGEYRPGLRGDGRPAAARHDGGGVRAARSQIRDGMRIDWDVPIPMDDGIVLRADVFRPPQAGKHPVILSYGPYGKGLHFADLYADQWRRMIEQHPDVPAGSTNKYQNWEVVDPEKWVPDGYACVRVDSRGCGHSPGFVNVWSRREALDLCACIEWAAGQSWSTGKIGLNGISYFAINQWQAAALEPPHLAAMCIWEGAADYYRDLARHGGILCTFGRVWFPSQVVRVQHGVGSRGYRSRMTGEWVAGPATLSEEQLGAARSDFYQDCRDNALASDE